MKTENVMLVPEPGGVRAVVTDFGLAVVADTDVTVRSALSSRSPPFWVAAASFAAVPPWLASSGCPAACLAMYLRIIPSRAAVRVVVPSGSTSMRLP